MAGIDKKANPSAPLMAYPGYSYLGEPHQSNQESYLLAHKYEVWAYACMSVIAKQLSSAPLIVEARSTKGGKQQWVKQESGDLVDLLGRPNPEYGMFQALWQGCLYLYADGAEYWYYDKKDRELWVFDSSICFVRKNLAGEIIGYKLRYLGREVDVDADAVVMIKRPSLWPQQSSYGQSVVEVVKDPILLNQAHRSFLKSFFQNNAFLGGILSTDQQLQNITEDTKRLRQQFEGAHQGTKKAGKWLIVDQGLKPTVLQPSLKDLMIDSVFKMTREEICAAFGVPPSTVGILEYANYANMDAQERFLWKHTILPDMRLFEDEMNARFVAQFGDGLRIRFETDKIEALKEDQKAKSDILVQYVNSGIITPNEAREELGKDPIDGGDEIHKPPSPMDQAPNDPAANNQGGTAPKKSIKSCDPKRKAMWAEHEKSLTRKERVFAAHMGNYFDGQCDRVIKAVKPAKGSPSTALLLSLRPWSRKTDPNEADGDTGRIFDIETENDILEKEITPLIRQTVVESGRQGLAQISGAASFDVNNPHVKIKINTFENRIKLINDTTWQKIRDILASAYENGDSIGTIEQNLRAMYSDFSKDRATLIARTEMNGMVNSGAVEGYRQGGIDQKEWLATQDEVTRDIHAEADGQVVGVGDPFIVGGESLDSPGDPAGSPWNVCNCRCAVMPVVGDN